jgi:haloacetate dehalogenase
MSLGWFDEFEHRNFDVNGTSVSVRFGGRIDGPTLMLVHGSPQTHVMWRRVSALLRDRYFLILPDLRGYGDSAPATDRSDHVGYSKRTMALDLLGVADLLGRDRILLAGHDRGGRVGHRLALDHPDRLTKLCVIDIAPTLDMYEATDAAFATAYYHWFHLIQPSPLPEQMIEGSARAYLHASLGGLGSAGLGHVEPEALNEYERCFTPKTIHAMCEDYRASAGVDLDHDRESRARAEKIECDVHVVWGQAGVVNRLFSPIPLWQAQCSGSVSGEVVPAGHFVPEQLPELTAEILLRFFDA